MTTPRETPRLRIVTRLPAILRLTIVAPVQASRIALAHPVVTKYPFKSAATATIYQIKP